MKKFVDLNKIKDISALGLYTYLTLTNDPEITKDYIRKHFSIGLEKLNKLFKYLIDLNLIRFEQEKLSNGRFSKVRIVIN